MRPANIDVWNAPTMNAGLSSCANNSACSGVIE